MPKSKRRLQQKKTQFVRTPTTAPETGTSQQTPPPVNRGTVAVTRAPQIPIGAARYPYIAGELKRIGILTAIILVILIVLVFALPRFI